MHFGHLRELKRAARGPSGIITALLTPLESDGTVRADALKELLDLQERAGVDGVFPLGTMGEGPYLNLTLKRRILRLVAEFCRLPIIVHVGSAVFEETLALARECDEYDNVCGVSAVGPFYYRPDGQGLANFYGSLAGATEKPVYVYNNPGRQGYNIGPSAFAAISREVPEVVGLKDTSNDLDQVGALVKQFGNSYQVYGAGDSLILAQLALGVRGHICGIGNAFPEVVVEIRDLAREGRTKEAAALQSELDAVGNDLGSFNLELAPYKDLLRTRGIDLGVPAKPLRPLSREEREELERKVRPFIEKHYPELA